MYEFVIVLLSFDLLDEDLGNFMIDTIAITINIITIATTITFLMFSF